MIQASFSTHQLLCNKNGKGRESAQCKPWEIPVLTDRVEGTGVRCGSQSELRGTRTLNIAEAKHLTGRRVSWVQG
jgi:hypothetical protein